MLDVLARPAATKPKKLLPVPMGKRSNQNGFPGQWTNQHLSLTRRHVLIWQVTLMRHPFGNCWKLN
jgi:hypothetical protein